jgi:hypothetical protein
VHRDRQRHRIRAENTDALERVGHVFPGDAVLLPASQAPVSDIGVIRRFVQNCKLSRSGVECSASLE